MRMMIQMLIGAFIGFIGAYGLLGFDFEKLFLPVSFPIAMILFGITVLLVLYSTLMIIKMKKKARLTLSGDEEDERAVWLYQKFSDITLAMHVAVIFSFLGFSIGLVTDQQLILVPISIALITVSVGLSIYIPTLAKIVYPDRKLPSPSEKDYAKKLLLASDEGERHVMLEGLYYSFNTTNLLLVIAILVLTLYSYGTGQSQLLSVIIIAFILILTNTQYFFKIRNK